MNEFQSKILHLISFWYVKVTKPHKLQLLFKKHSEANRPTSRPFPSSWDKAPRHINFTATLSGCIWTL